MVLLAFIKHMLSVIFILQGSAPDAKEIMVKAEKKMQGESNRSEMTMTIERPDWSREIGITTWSKGIKLSIILITSPARDKGSAFLKRNKEIWNWQPRIDRTIKLPPSMMMQSWMGSDFSNDDLVKESSISNDYYHSYLKDTLIENYQCYKIELIPKEDAPVVWGKIHAYVEKEEYFQLLVKYFDEDGLQVNTMILSDVKEMGGRLLPTRLEMIPTEEEDRKTVIVYNHMEFDFPIQDDFFSLQNMKRVR